MTNLPNYLIVSMTLSSKPLAGFTQIEEDPEIPMKNLIRAAFVALSLATIAPVANAADFHNGSTIAGNSEATRMVQTGSYSE
jgi:hypothetical protein